MSYDELRISKLISEIESYFQDLSQFKLKKEELFDKKTFYSVSMILFQLINRAIDLGEEIITEKKLGAPEKYKDIFYLLYKAKIIDLGKEQSFFRLVRLRNIIAHQYDEFNESDLFNAIPDLESIKTLVKTIKKLINS